MSAEELKIVEQEIDRAFSETEMINLGFSQAVWTLLSVVEDHHFKIRVFKPLEAEQQKIYVDGLLNALTYPLQICLRDFPLHKRSISKQLIDKDYDAANFWIDKAQDYTHFCSIFPLFHHGEIELKVSGNNIVPTDWTKCDLSYEVYDRFVQKRHHQIEDPITPDRVAASVLRHTTTKRDTFNLNFSPRLVNSLKVHLQDSYDLRFTLPEDWQFKHFSIQEFKEVFTTIQSMSYGWFIARQFACDKGVEALGFRNALWTPSKIELLSRLKRYTGIQQAKIERIIDYLTFGNAGIRNPDIAIQPIVDLKNGNLAISTFIFMNVNCERNLCVLLNQIKSERKLYSKLVKDKEAKLRRSIIEKMKNTRYEFKHGTLENTDLDLAIIDRDNKKCLAIELKWFIEPAEIREVIQRSEEVKKGVEQAQKISASWKAKDSLLIENILEIDEDFDLLAIVAPVTSIGNLTAQDDATPVIKTWHLIEKILRDKDLGKVMDWLRNRDYLPKVNIDYKIEKIDIKSGKWNSNWYGILPL